MKEIFSPFSACSVRELKKYYPCPPVKPGSYVYASDSCCHINVPLKVAGIDGRKILVQLPPFWRDIECNHGIRGWKLEERVYKNKLEESLEEGKLYWYMSFWKPAKDHSKEYNIE